uniref:Ribonuclease H-like domain, reverse transcriptase, RNA-dependent DNA polymerase n=1 Tax=Tanacetum cinerariifolium TaxID=118510 RepID=A0A6L2M0M7_TANCI|nr:ribonuclease H-like domain, reverse transcriptase, RNA-dependent DNA polymerase [Tanacetum cinerariifolium]
MKMEHYLSHTDYPIWKVIHNENGHVSVTTETNGLIKVLPPKTAEEVMAREKERKARNTLLMALREDHLANFHKMADAKEMWEAIKSRFSGNDESKKMQKYLLKQQFEGFSVSTLEGLHKGYDRSLPSSWSQVALIMRTKPGLDTLSFNDLYNNLRVFKSDVKGTNASSLNTQNVVFVSVENTSITNDVAMISMRIKKFHKRTGRKLQFDTKDPVGFDKTEVECFNCHKIGHFARDCRAKRNQYSRRRDVGYNRNKTRDNGRRPAYQDDSKALVIIDGEDIDWSGHVEEDAQNYAMLAYSSINSGSDNETSADESDSKPSEYASCDSDSSVETSTSMPEPVENASKVVCEPKVWTDAPIIEEYESDSDNDSVFNAQEDKEKPSFASTDSVKHVKTSREILKKQTQLIIVLKLRSKIEMVTLERVWDMLSLEKHALHMTRNKAHLADYQEFKGGSIAFGSSNGRITGKGKIKAGRLDFEDVYYVEELKHYNLFFVSQTCDKKNKVLFIDTDCLVLSPDFKLPDENQVLLKIPRQNNMCSFNLKNVDPSGDLACLFVKASTDESNKWHRRLGHVNFKNIKKLMKGNLVRGLPSKIFENDHTCVTCQKRKQHKASYKAKTGIKRECSNARTPQQNRVAERKNMTLIEAARTMLADSFLPTTFWAEVVNTACYVLNKVLVTKPQNKTPYELLTENDLNEEHFVLPIWFAYSPTVKSSRDKIEKNTDFKTCEKPVSQVEQNASTSSTNLINTASTALSTAGPSRAFNDGELSYLDDPSMPHLEDIYASPSDGIFTDSSYDNEGVVTDFNNLETTTRSKVNKNSKAHALISQALEDESWVYAIQKELLQFQIQKVWILVDFPFGKKAIGTKWVYISKKDERGVVVRNKALVVAQGHRQEEGIDYDEVFAPMATIEAIRIFLAFASYMGFIFYQIDVKSTFLYGIIDEEVYRIGAIDKTLFIKQDKKDIMLVQVYVDDIIFGSTKKSWCDEFEELMNNSVKTASTHIETQKPLVKDKEAVDVDVHLYRSMIGSLMYLTASRPNIMFAEIYNRRLLISWQETYLMAMQKANYCGYFYYRGIICCCSSLLWTSSMDSNYGFNFMNTKIYIDNESTICIVKNPVFHSKIKHIEIRHHFIRDAYEKRLIQVLKIHTDNKVDDILTKAFDVSSKELASPKKTALGKDISNLLMAGKFPKTTLPTSELKRIERKM